MPQLDIYVTKGIKFDAAALFSQVEALLNKLDSTAGACKSRAFNVDEFLHDHVFLRVRVLQKPHRDEAFMRHCADELKSILYAAIPRGCYYSVDLDFSGPYYLTDEKQ